MTNESVPGSSPAGTSVLLATVGNKIRNMRKDKGMTLAKLSEVTGLSPAIVSQIERGLANPSFTTLAQLAHGLDIPVGKFFLGRKKPGPRWSARASGETSRALPRSRWARRSMNCSPPTSTAPWRHSGS